MLREEAGESPWLEDYLSRFGELADELRLQFEVEMAICSESSVIDADHVTIVGAPRESGRQALPSFRVTRFSGS
jgi:hypothetical protein